MCHWVVPHLHSPRLPAPPLCPCFISSAASSSQQKARVILSGSSASPLTLLFTHPLLFWRLAWVGNDPPPLSSSSSPSSDAAPLNSLTSCLLWAAGSGSAQAFLSRMVNKQAITAPVTIYKTVIAVSFWDYCTPSVSPPFFVLKHVVHERSRQKCALPKMRFQTLKKWL